MQIQDQYQPRYSEYPTPPVADVGKNEEGSVASVVDVPKAAAKAVSVAPPLQTTGPTLASEAMDVLLQDQAAWPKPVPVDAKPVNYSSMVADPEQGAKSLAFVARFGIVLLMPPAGETLTGDEWEAFKNERAAQLAETTAVVHDRVALHDRMTEEGKSPAQIYKELVRQELQQSDSYWAIRDPGGSQNIRQMKLEELADIQKQEAAAFVASGSNIPRSAAVIAQDYAVDLATNPGFADQEAHRLAYGMDVMIIPSDVFEKATAGGGGMAMISNGYGMDDPGNPVLKIQKQRQDLYAYLKDNGATSIQIIEEIRNFNINLPLTYSDDFLDPTNSYPAEEYRNWQKEEYSNLRDAMAWAGIKSPPSDIENIPEPQVADLFSDPPAIANAADDAALDLKVEYSEQDRELLRALAGYSVDDIS